MKMYIVIITIHGTEVSRYTVKNINVTISQLDYVAHSQDGNVHTFEMRKASEDCSIPNTLSSGFTGTYVK